MVMERNENDELTPELPMAKRIRPLLVRIADQKERLDRLMLQQKIQELRGKQRPRRKIRR